MARDRGRNAGLTGLVDIKAADDSWSGKLPLQCTVISRSIECSTIDASGRGDGIFGEYRTHVMGGICKASGLFPSDKNLWPIPTNVKDLTGTVTIQYDSVDGTPCKETFSVRFTSDNITLPKASNDYTASIDMLITSVPVPTGWTGTQPVTSAATYTAKELWRGIVKSKDADTTPLYIDADQLVLIWGCVDSDSAEVTEIGARITAASTAPITGLVLQRVRFNRVSSLVCYMTFHWSLRTSAQELVSNQTKEHIDKSGLSSDKYTAVLWSTSAPADGTQSGYSLVDYTDLSTSNPTYTLRVYRWALVTNQQRIELGGTSASGNIYTPPVTNVINASTEIKTCSSGDTVDDLAVAEFGTYKNVAAWAGLSVRKITPTKYVVTVRKVNDDKLVTYGASRSGWQELPSTSDGAYVKVGWVEAAGTGQLYVQLAPINYWVVEQSIMLRRRIISQTAVSGVDQASLIGKVNTDTFLNRGAGTMSYSGARIMLNWTLEGGAHLYVVDYDFHYRNIGFGRNSNPIMGHRYLLTGTTSTYKPGLTPLAATFATACNSGTWPADGPATTAFNTSGLFL